MGIVLSGMADVSIKIRPNGPYLVLHGDIFDTITSRFVFLAHVGDWGYQLLLKINRVYNAWRAWRGKEYWSLSKAIKARVKSAVSHVGSFEDHLVRLARERGCVGIICGHIHTPADKQCDGIHYLNSGDWVESLTAIVEHWDGRFELIDFASFVRNFPMREDEDDFPDLVAHRPLVAATAKAELIAPPAPP